MPLQQQIMMIKSNNNYNNTTNVLTSNIVKYFCSFILKVTHGDLSFTER